MTYRSSGKIPDHLSEFYDSIFQVVLQRHDVSKAGFKREKCCSFSEHQYKNIFEAFCYRSKRVRKFIFKYEEVISFAKEALKENNLEAVADRYVDDIVKVTCLLLKEGNDYRFIHTSVQEYYAAVYIKHRLESKASKFYGRLAEENLRIWKQELYFLSVIDRYRYSKYYLVPVLCRVINCIENKTPEKIPDADIESARRLLGEISFGINIEENSIKSLSLPMSVRTDILFRLIKPGELFDFSKPILQTIKAGEIEAKTIDGFFDIKIGTLLDRGLLVEKILAITKNILLAAYNDIRTAEEFIKTEDSKEINPDMINLP
jgi:hypothetical protein